MTKTIVKHCLCAGFGVVLGLSVGTFYWKINEEAHPLVNTNAHSNLVLEDEKDNVVPEKLNTNDSWALLQTAFLAVNALESQDYTTLASMVHKEKGVRFTPYSTVNLESDLVFSCDEIKNLAENTAVYTWGASPATGSSVSLPMSRYFEQHVSPRTYSKAPHVAIDAVLINGNALENTGDAYPEGRFVDFSFRAVEPERSGHDWSSLKLVFEVNEDAWYLVGMVHSVWTL